MNVFSAYMEKPKNVRFATQEPGEKIIFALRRSFVTNIPWLFLSALALVLPIIYMNYTLENGSTFFEGAYGRDLENLLIILWYLLTAMYIIERFITWYFNVYVVTDRRLIDIDFFPLFHKRVSEATYDNVEDSSLSTNNLFQVIFNYGHVHIQTAAEKREFEFHDVPHPDLVQDKISDFAAAAGGGNE